ncbi:MAG: ABC transporter ATP-binding protein, partial [Sulfobacillus sp.]|nr:ABC transporter ATP-binding protein [Sulfobacillus sp.]
MASVVVDHVSKRFALRKDRADSVGQLLARMIPGRYRRPRSEQFWALKDISFEMPPGISYGIIGSNGSGKSTLLKILTRTMIPTKGRVSVNGRVSALIELGAGFHPDFTGRENVYLNASILGIPRRVVDQKMDDIIDFADIRPFIDTPVKYYSSGMHARLGFSVATSVEPEILIVDEVLAVGDEAFQQRCMDRIFRMKRQGTSILLVSHDLGSIERLMDRALWINKGEMQVDGLPHDVVRAYREALLGEQQKGGDDTPPIPEGTVTLEEIRMTARDRASEVLLSGEPAILTMKFL